MDQTQDVLLDLFNYDPETGILTWKARSERFFACPLDCEKWNNRHAGQRAGWSVFSADGNPQARAVSIFGKNHYEHRVIWKIVTGKNPPRQIDHLDRNPHNNKWLNLRASNSSRNMKNKSMYRQNTSGITGVYWHKRDRVWEAKCRVDGKLVNIGRFSCKLEAGLAVQEFRRKAEFTEGHGSPRSTKL